MYQIGHNFIIYYIFIRSTQRIKNTIHALLAFFLRLRLDISDTPISGVIYLTEL